MFKKDDLGAEFKKICLRDYLFFLFLKANTILFNGNLEGSRSLDCLTCGCFVNCRTDNLHLCALSSEFIHVTMLLRAQLQCDIL